ncbi:MAG: tetratricopeptide repeat protein [Candidatus Accumulibacter sp.]|jgi:tetratricopeptide (TPR) repeat protein|nr:tetratricopeptide repeat protein [Accumulibacter sp.]
MNTHLSSSAIALSFLLAFSVPVRAAEDDPARRAVFEQSRAEAASLMEKGDAEGAYELYMRLLRLVPGDDATNLGLARAASRSNHLNQAVIAYETLLEKYPRDTRLFGELTDVYMRLGDRAGAERSAAMMRSLDGKTTQEETDSALDALEKRYSELQVHGKLRGGVLFDSNVNLGPRSNTLDLGNWRVRLNGAKEKESPGVYLGADLDLGQRVARDSPWWFVGDVQTFWRANTAGGLDKLHNRRSQWARAAAGMRHMTSKTLAEARFKAEVFDYEFYQHVSARGPEGTFIYAAAPTFHLVSKASIDHRIYSRDGQRNGIYSWVGQYGRFFFGSSNHELLIGGRYLKGSADRHDYSHDGWEAYARFVFKLPRGFEFAPFAGYTREDYKGPATVLETLRRSDKRLRTGFGLTYRVDRAWSWELNYQYSKNRSTSDLYDYGQYYVSTGMAFSF